MKYAELVNLSISPVTYFTRVEWGCPRLSRLGGLGEHRKLSLRGLGQSQEIPWHIDSKAGKTTFWGKVFQVLGVFMGFLRLFKVLKIFVGFLDFSVQIRPDTKFRPRKNPTHHSLCHIVFCKL